MRMGLREYSRHRGVTTPAVLKAIRNGRIERGEDGKIDQEEADAAWNRNTDPSQTRGESEGVVPLERSTDQRPVRSGTDDTSGSTSGFLLFEPAEIRRGRFLLP